MFPTIHRNTTIGTAQVNAVSARDLHKKLGVKTHVTTWVKRRIEESLLMEDIDYTRFSIAESEMQHGGQNKTDYFLTLDAAKHIAMLERTEGEYKVGRNWAETR